VAFPVGCTRVASFSWCWSNSHSVQCRPNRIRRAYCILLNTTLMLCWDSVILMRLKLTWHKAGKWRSLTYCWTLVVGLWAYESASFCSFSASETSAFIM
jgi:hypothetical protein